MRKVVYVFLGVVGAWLVVGNLLHHVVFPGSPPDPATFPVAGDRFGSVAEGFQQEVLAVQDGWVSLRLELAPGAQGPPLHVHDRFDERFEVAEGVLSVEFADGVRDFEAGSTLTIPRGTPHRPHNPTDSVVVLESEAPTMPQSFAACLVQLYPALDAGGPAVLMQISVADPNLCDTHLADVPRPIQTAMNAVVAPAARLAGYQPYDPSISLHPPGE